MNKVNLTYGIHIAINTLQKDPASILKIYIDKNRKDKRLNEVRKLAQKHKCTLEETTKDQLNNYFPQLNHQGVVIEFKKDVSIRSKWSLVDLLVNLQYADHSIFLIILDSITDSRNMGACVRSAAIAGATAVVIPKHRSAKIDSYAIKASSGGTSLIPIVTVSSLNHFIDKIQDLGVAVIASKPKGGTTINQLDCKQPIAFILGSESRGIKNLLVKKSDINMTIPMKNPSISYNVSVACGIICYEVQRQRSL